MNDRFPTTVKIEFSEFLVTEFKVKTNFELIGRDVKVKLVKKLTLKKKNRNLFIKTCFDVKTLFIFFF